jgi:hypothetical protein
MEPYLISFLTGIVSGWGANSMPDPESFSLSDPAGINIPLIYRGKTGRLLLEVLHYQFLLAAGLIILEIILLPIHWYLTVICFVAGVVIFSFFLRFYRSLNREDSPVDLVVHDSPIVASLSFLGIIVLLVLVIFRWWGK